MKEKKQFGKSLSTCSIPVSHLPTQTRTYTSFTSLVFIEIKNKISNWNKNHNLTLTLKKCNFQWAIPIGVNQISEIKNQSMKNNAQYNLIKQESISQKIIVYNFSIKVMTK